MASQSEVGHAKNVANLEALIINAQALGTAYQPANNRLKITALNALLTNGDNALLEVNKKLSPYHTAVAARKVEFNKMDKLVTRTVNIIKATDNKVEIKAVQATNRKIKSIKAKDPKGAGTAASVSASDSASVLGSASTSAKSAAPSDAEISNSQQSFDLRVEHFTLLVQQLATYSDYAPNETDLKVTALNTWLNKLKTLNTAVITASVALHNARVARNKVLYAPISGLVDVGNASRSYVRGVFGQTSPEYKPFVRIVFRKD